MDLSEINYGNLGKKILIWFVIAIVCYGAFRVCYPNKNKQDKPSVDFVENGYYTINTSCYGAFTKESLESVVRYVSNGNREAVAYQLATGEIIGLDAGTKATLVKYGMAQCKVDIVSGKYAGQTVYVITEFLSK